MAVVKSAGQAVTVEIATGRQGGVGRMAGVDVIPEASRPTAWTASKAVLLAMARKVCRVGAPSGPGWPGAKTCVTVTVTPARVTGKPATTMFPVQR